MKLSTCLSARWPKRRTKPCSGSIWVRPKTDWPNLRRQSTPIKPQSRLSLNRSRLTACCRLFTSGRRCRSRPCAPIVQAISLPRAKPLPRICWARLIRFWDGWTKRRKSIGNGNRTSPTIRSLPISMPPARAITIKMRSPSVVRKIMSMSPLMNMPTTSRAS